MQKARSHGRDVVLLNATADEPEICSVVVNNELGGYLAAKHLIGLGRTKLMFAGGYDQVVPLRDRRSGAQRAVDETDGAVTIEHVPTPEVQAEHGRTVGAAILSRIPSERPDGVVAAADLLAIGLLQTLSAANVRVPEDIAIIGHDNNQSAWDSHIPLSTISQPGHDLGAAAARLLIEEIKHPDRHVHRSVILEPSLLAKESSIGRRI